MCPTQALARVKQLKKIVGLKKVDTGAPAGDVEIRSIVDRLRAATGATHEGIPLDYLLAASDTTLKNFALSRLTAAANLRREARAIEREALTNELAGELASFIERHRAEILAAAAARITDEHPELCSHHRSIDSTQHVATRVRVHSRKRRPGPAHP